MVFRFHFAFGIMYSSCLRRFSDYTMQIRPWKERCFPGRRRAFFIPQKNLPPGICRGGGFQKREMVSGLEGPEVDDLCQKHKGEARDQKHAPQLPGEAIQSPKFSLPIASMAWRPP